MKKRPINTIKILDQIQLENEGTYILSLNRMESLLNNTNRLNGLSVLKKAILFLRDTGIQGGLKPDNNNFGDQFIQQIT